MAAQNLVKLQGTQKSSSFQRFLDSLISPALSKSAWRTQLAQEEFPGIIGLEVTSICNLKCPMCPRTFSPRKFGHMPLSVFTRLIDEIAAYDERRLVEQLALQGYGEIFLHPEWFEIIEYASTKIKNAHVRLDSNGTLMKPSIVDRVFESSLKSLIISVDGVDEKSYNFLRAGGKFQQTIENVQYFIQKRRQEPDRGPAAFIQVIESDYTREYVPGFKEFWTEQLKGVQRMEISIIQYHNFAGQIDDDAFEQRKQTGLHVNMPCYRLTYELDVSSDGIATVCCMDSERQLAIGNVNETSLSEMWHGEQLRRYREQMREANYESLELCKTCPHSQKFIANYASPSGIGRAVSRVVNLSKRYTHKKLFE
jgi:radical SAM protein with 4Fe4S-binding SPASM domain